MMRAAVCHEFGPYENLTLETVPPPALPPRGVRIAVRAAGVSFATNLVVAGRYQRKPPLPFTPGVEVGGIVSAVAEGVASVRPGDRVMAALDWGAWAEEAAASEACTYPIPDGMPFDAATAFPISYATALAALDWKARLRPGESLLVHGAAGAVGLAAVEIGKAMGATVLATAGSADKLALAREHGADIAIDNCTGRLRDAVREATGGRGVDVVFDPVGGAVTEASLRCLDREGRLVTIGYASGAIPSIPANLLLVKNIAAIGLNYGTYLGWGPDDGRELFAGRVAALQQRLGGWYAEGRLRPVVSHRFPLSRFKEAMAAVLARQSRGKVVLVPDEV